MTCSFKATGLKKKPRRGRPGLLAPFLS